MKKAIITTSAICILLSVKAQFTYDYLKAADEYYRKTDYFSAAQYYEKYLSSNGVIKNGEFDPYVIKAGNTTRDKKEVSSKEQAVYNLAESYRQLHYYIKAEPFYKQAATFDEKKFPLADFHYATTLRALGRFEEAEKGFRQFLAEYSMQDKFQKAAHSEIQSLQFIQSQLQKKDIGQYTINLSDDINGDGANYAPAWDASNMLYFTSTRPEEVAGKKQYVNKVYSASYQNGRITNPAKLFIAQPNEIHQGGVSITADGNTMYLTRWKVGEGKKSASIYISHKKNGSWSEPTALTTIINDPNSNNKQPFIMPNGKLLFSSDRAGGMGGFDLYLADINGSGEATNVVNMSSLNTEFDEEAPYYHDATKTLVFASNGRIGMGGFDLFFSTLRDGKWSDPENFGYPVNSIKNDMYFFSGGDAKNILQNVLLSSDRSAECCLQMYTLSKVNRPKLLAGTVVDCKTNTVLAGVQVNVIDTANKTVFSGKTTESGSYHFTMERFTDLQIDGILSGYTAAKMTVQAPGEDAEKNTLSVLCLNKIPTVGTVEVLDHVYFAFNKAIVLEESHAALDKLVKMLQDNPTIAVEIGGHTDNKGDNEYNQKLSEARAKSVVDYLISKGIDWGRLVAIGYGESMPIAPNTNPDGTDYPEGREKNRRTEFKVIKN